MNNWNWQIENDDYLEHAVQRCKQKGVILPTFQQLKYPETIPPAIQQKLEKIDLNDLNPLNLYRINWKNDVKTGKIGNINYLEIPQSITGVPSRIIGLVGKHFPTGAHKVGATYGCLIPYLITGRFNPDYHKAVWPSTGNYCRGGVFNSALLSVHAVAILPEGMSRERFDWLNKLGAEIYATPGSESNVKEIYDKCHELEAKSDEYFIFNQFDQFGNAVWHYEITGLAIESLYNQLKQGDQKLSGYVSATGSAGTIAAGDYLRTKFPLIKILASEALQCPTLLMNGFGSHRIEGIGDKHVPWIHNVKNTDLVCAIDDELPLRILRLFNEPEGKAYLSKLEVSSDILNDFSLLGISSISNLLSAVKLAKYFELTKNDIIFTIFTDSVDMYKSRLKEMNETEGNYSIRQAELDWKIAIENQKTDFIKELTYHEKKAIHNLKYFTWVEQQGKNVIELNAQWFDNNYWYEKFSTVKLWDELINNFNQRIAL
jgi:cysteine synthase